MNNTNLRPRRGARRSAPRAERGAARGGEVPCGVLSASEVVSVLVTDAELLAAGAEVHEIPGTVVHAKVVVADDTVSFGTLNFDAWSLHRDSELMLLARSAALAAGADDWLPLMRGARIGTASRPVREGSISLAPHGGDVVGHAVD